MNEKLVLKRSALIFLIGFVIFLIVGFIMKSVSYPLGFLLGYLFNLAIFYVIIITSDMILNLKKSTSLIILLLAIYAIGFLIAIFIPKWFNLIGVLFGYMVIKITIYIVSYQMKEVKE